MAEVLSGADKCPRKISRPQDYFFEGGNSFSVEMYQSSTRTMAGFSPLA
jgi:hypothetical protein